MSPKLILSPTRAKNYCDEVDILQALQKTLRETAQKALLQCRREHQLLSQSSRCGRKRLDYASEVIWQTKADCYELVVHSFCKDGPELKQWSRGILSKFIKYNYSGIYIGIPLLLIFVI